MPSTSLRPRVAALLSVLLALLGISLTAIPASAASATSLTYTITSTSPTYNRLSPGTCAGSTSSYYKAIQFETNGVGNDAYSITINASAGVTATLYQGSFLPTIPIVNCYIAAQSVSGSGTMTTGYNNSGLPDFPTQQWYLVLASDSPGVGVTVSATFNTTIASVREVLPDPTIVLDTPSAANGTAGTAYSQSFSASGGTSPYTYTRSSGTLPPGLTLSTAGVLSGSPTTPGTYTFGVRARDAGNFAGTRSYTVSIAANVTLSPTTVPAASVGVAYAQTISASLGTPAYSYAVTAGSLPAGLTLNTSTGVLSGTPTAGGTFTFTVTGTDSLTMTGSRNYTLTVAAPTISVSPASLPLGMVNSALSQTLTAGGGTAPYTFAVTAGALPTGLTLSSSGVLSGTPTLPGTFNFTATATDSSTGTGPFTSSRAYSLTIDPQILLNPQTLPTAGAGVSYSQNLTASGGTPPYGFAVTAGSLPPGLTLSPTGSLTGRPTAVGTYTFSVTATDANDKPGTQAYTVVVGAPTLILGPTSLPDETVHNTYSEALSASGGTAPYAYSVASGSLPPGLTLTGGTVTGTPTTAGTYTFGIRAQDSTTGTGAPFSVTRNYTVTIDPDIDLTPAVLPSGRAAVSYGLQLSASGGVGPYSFAVTAGTLPAGLTLSPGGMLSGMPIAAGSFPFTLTATDANGDTGAQQYSLVMAAPELSLSPADLPGGTATTGYNQSISAGGGTGPYTYEVSAGALPNGLTLDPEGAVSGTPTRTGSYQFTIQATDSTTGTGAPFRVSRVYSVTIGSPTVTVMPETIPGGTAGTGYSQTITADGGQAPYTFTVSTGSLPPGLTLGSDGILAGTPSQTGSFTFGVAVADATETEPGRGAIEYTVQIGAPTLTVQPDELPAPAAGNSYSQSLSATGGVSPYSFTVSAGSLPAGLTLSSGGLLSGTPTAAGTFPFTVSVTDSTQGSETGTASREYSLNVGLPTLAVTPATLPGGNETVSYWQTISASGGTPEYSFALTAGSLPPGLALSADGTLSGIPTAAGRYSFTVTATDQTTGTGPATGSQVISVTIGGKPCLTTDVTLASGQTWNSPASVYDGLPYKLRMQTDGNVVLLAPDGKLVWATGTVGNPGARLVMQGDGNLVVYSSSNKVLWAATLATPALAKPLTGCSTLAVQADGNLVIYSPAEKALWSTGVDGLVAQSPAFTGTSITPGKTMRAGSQLTVGNYHLNMQTDGNLVLYNAANKAVWESKTKGNPYAWAILQSTDGNFVMYQRNGPAVWTTGKLGGAEVTLTADGKVVERAKSGSVLWSAP